MSLSEHLRQVSEIDPDAIALYFAGRGYTWKELRRTADALADTLDRAGIPPGAPVGWIARNHPSIAAAALGILLSRRCVSPFNPLQPHARLGEQLASLRMPVVVGIAEDWTEPVIAGARSAGSVGIVVDIDGAAPARLLDGLEHMGSGPFYSLPPGVVLERNSSGTTGEPKRIPVTEAVVETSMRLADRSTKAPKSPAGPSLKSSAGLHIGPFGHASGVFHLIMWFYQGRPFVLFDKFDAQAWAAAVERFKVKTGSLVPSMINMVLQANPPASQLSSLICVRSGTAPLDPAAKAEFERRYNIPVLTEYGASEFMGGVAAWTLADHREWSAKKPGAAGRLRPDVEARIVDAATGEILPFGQTGVLQLKSNRWGADWIATTDLASLDEDRFLYIHGRADEAIIRGGFKILPEKVAEVLRRHPGVRDACVLGIKDKRLGQAPLAIVERMPDASLTPQELEQVVREHLPAYNVPVAFEIVDQLPRTPSLKVSRPGVRERFAGSYEFVT
jgi:acyl-CoA synthetase (AMP-forming)/AMP-acid ligase II